MIQMILPKWMDLHTHFRQGEAVADYISDHLAMGCVGALAMPNTKPPVAAVFQSDEGEYWSIERYRSDLMAAGADAFDHLIIPLYLTKDTTPEMIAKGAEAGILQACKAYPPHGTTGAEFGVPITTFIDNGVFAAMQDHGVVLCVHGEEHELPTERYFDRGENAEEIFYAERMPRVRDALPDLKIVCEHVTTRKAVEFVQQAGERTAATITPQHLLYTIGDLIQGLKYHLFCLPVLKFQDDRQALRDAVLDGENTQFFAGTDSAPHAEKVTECGCAAGCYTGGIAPQLYAQAFEEAGADLGSEIGQDLFRRFLCENGPSFYDLPIPEDTFSLIKQESEISCKGCATPLPKGLGINALSWFVDRL